MISTRPFHYKLSVNFISPLVKSVYFLFYEYVVIVGCVWRDLPIKQLKVGLYFLEYCLKQ